MKAQDMFNKLERVRNLPTLPTIALEINRLLQNYDTGIQDIVQIIETDQSIATKILRLVNSAFFGLRSKVNNIHHAVMLLGFNTVRNAVVSVSIVDAFSKDSGLDEFEITDFWKHSVAVAILSRFMAETSRLHNPDDCFMAGLVHDIGKLVLVQYFRDLFMKLWNHSKTRQCPFIESETEIIAVNHAFLGGFLAEKWRFPRGIVDTIRHHHSVNSRASDRYLVSIVHIADQMANQRIPVFGLPVFHSRINKQAAIQLKAALAQTSRQFASLEEEIEDACHFFLKGFREESEAVPESPKQPDSYENGEADA